MQHVTVCYIQLDTPRSLWADRLLRQSSWGFPVEKILFGDRETLGCWPFNILDPDHQLVLAESLHEVKPDVVFIDTLRECCSGAEENDSTQMQQVVAQLTAVVQPAALVLVHHGKKPGLDGSRSTINDARGSNYITGRMDSIVQFHEHGITYSGRAIEEGELSLERVPRGERREGTWRLSKREEARKLAQNLLADDTYPSLRSKARELASRTGKTEEAALSLLSRIAAKEDSF